MEEHVLLPLWVRTITVSQELLMVGVIIATSLMACCGMGLAVSAANVVTIAANHMHGFQKIWVDPLQVI